MSQMAIQSLRLQLQQTLSISQIRLFSDILAMTNGELFDFLKKHEGKGDSGTYPMFSIEKAMTVPRHLDIWVKNGIIREASTNYIRYATNNESGGKSRRVFSFIAWMLRAREKILKVATDFILRHHHGFFWGDKKYLVPISIKAAVDCINGRSEDFFLDKSIDYTMFSRVIKNKIISVEGKEYSMRFFFTARKVHPHEIKRLFEEVLEDNPKLSDRILSKMIYDKIGYPLARRTIAKYRGELKILPLHKRKK